MGKTTTIRSIMGLTPARRRDPFPQGRRFASFLRFGSPLGIGLVPKGVRMFPT
jgi:ABC-type branched-subunit amino acid transport system ATPase component